MHKRGMYVSKTIMFLQVCFSRFTVAVFSEAFKVCVIINNIYYKNIKYIK